MKIEKIDSSQKDGPTKTEKLEKGAMKKAIDLHLAQEKSSINQSKDFFNESKQDNFPDKKVDQSTAIKITAYGGPDQTEDRGKGERYLNADDGVLQSADMTIMSGKGLNITGIHKREKPQGQTSNKQSEIEDHGRLDTQEDEFDLQTITKIHAQK